MTGSTDWLSAIGILLSGVVLGLMFIYAYVRRRQNTAAVGESDLEMRELQAKRDALIQQLRELEDSGDATPEERKRLETKTAEVLRAIDGKPSKSVKAAVGVSKPSSEPVVAAPAGYFGRNPAVKGFLYGVVSFAALAFLGFYVYHFAQQRGEGAGVTGGTGMQPQGMAAQAPQQQPDPAVLQLEAAVKAAPADLEKRIELARAYLDRDNMMGVFEQTKYVLEKNPNEPRAQTYNAIVRMSMGQLPDAKRMLEAATKTDPTITDAWVALAWMGIQEGRVKDAEAAMAAAIKAHPEQEARLREVFGQMQGQAQKTKASPLPPGAEGQPLPPGHPAVDANGAPATAMAMAAAAAPSPMGAPGSAPPAADAVHITLNIDPAANPKSGIVYVLARPLGQAGGPPIAVKRLNVASFPAKIEFSSSDSMMGDPLPAKMHIEARLAPTGDVTTKKPTDPHAATDGVATKSTLTLTLK